jgi:hypothetical protein
MSSVWTKVRKNTPEIDCGLCGFTTCGAFARAAVTEKVEISQCPILGLEQYTQRKHELTALTREDRNTEKLAPEQTNGGVLLSKPCTDSPDLLMAEMRIFNGVKPSAPMRFGVLDPAILCWLLDCVSTRYEDMRCSKDLAYAWGNMDEIKVHILRDGRVKMRRARGAEHALDSFKIIERTIMGAVICNCCGRDLLTVLAGFVDSTEDHHTVLDAGSTVSLNKDLIDWTPQDQTVDNKPISQMVDLIDEIYSDLLNEFDQIVTGKGKQILPSETRSIVCKIISLMVDPLEIGNETVFLRGLALAFFIDDAMMGLSSLAQLMIEGEVEESFINSLLDKARNLILTQSNLKNLGDSEILAFAHSNRVQRAIQLYHLWKKL